MKTTTKLAIAAAGGLALWYFMSSKTDSKSDPNKPETESWWQKLIPMGA